MKKTLIFFLIFIFLVPTLVFSAENVNLEKIPSPDQIKYFKVMKKEGNALFGVRLNKEVKEQTAAKNEKMESSDKAPKPSSTLEKISGPWEINLFQNIKRISNALWGYRKEEKREDKLGYGELTPEIITCLKTAIDKKDKVITNTITTASTELVEAVADRNTCQKAALDFNVNEVTIKAFKICKEDFDMAVKKSRESAKKSRDEAWKVYKYDTKTCYGSHITPIGTEPKEEAQDITDDTENILFEDGGENLDL